MHATKRQVVWFRDLDPGESIPVYTVGLDAPLLLLLNVGYCRTPVGEGALVHHGSGKQNMFSHNLYLNNKVKRRPKVAEVTESQSIDFDALKEVNSPSSLSRDKKRVNNTSISAPPEKKLGSETLNESADTSSIKERNIFYNINDIATETTVVDSLGQCLNLNIKNTLGGGGQRHITVSCPYWILNTTEHILRYKQDKAKKYVSGTVTSIEKDGSINVDDSSRNQKGRSGTIFPGRPGALANFLCKSKSRVNEFTGFVCKDIPLAKLADMAFMFNYHDFRSFGDNQKLCIQLMDTTERGRYTSEWSTGFSLESVGVSQMYVMHICNKVYFLLMCFFLNFSLLHKLLYYVW